MIHVGQVEVNVVRHCTNKCVACSHASPFAEKYEMPPDSLRRDLRILAPLLHAREFHIVGGEPLLHPRLEELLDIVNESPIADVTVLSTNGKLLEHTSDAVLAKLDRLRLSVYPNLAKGVPELAESRCTRLGIQLEQYYTASFWKQFRASLDAASFKDCPWKHQCLTIHDGWFFRCSQSAFFREIINRRITPDIDGLRLDETTTAEQVRVFISSDVPLLMCHFCAGYKDSTAWSECRDFQQWLSASTL